MTSHRTPGFKRSPVGHTYFMREPEALHAIRENVIPRTNRHRGTCHIWCAGCSTGEEPYSVAIVAAEAGAAVEILGTDIDRQALSVARRGHYRQQQLRHVAEAQRRRWFIRRKGHCEVSNELKRTVRFLEHNVVTDPPPFSSSPGTPRGQWDVILCRYVGLYLDDAELAAVRERFARALAPEGILVLGAAERMSSADSGFEVRVLDGVAVHLVATKEPANVERGDRQEAPPPAAAPARPSRSSAAPVASLAEQVHQAREQGDARVDARDWQGALAHYATGIRLDALATDLYLRSAVCCVRLERPDDAREHLRRALFLAPDLWPAAILMAELSVASDAASSRTYYRQAHQALTKTEPCSISESQREHLAPYLVDVADALERVELRLGIREQQERPAKPGLASEAAGGNPILRATGTEGDHG